MTVKWLDLSGPPHLPALYAHAAARRKIEGEFSFRDNSLPAYLALLQELSALD